MWHDLNSFTFYFDYVFHFQGGRIGESLDGSGVCYINVFYNNCIYTLWIIDAQILQPA